VEGIIQATCTQTEPSPAASLNARRRRPPVSRAGGKTFSPFAREGEDTTPLFRQPRQLHVNETPR